MTGERRRSISEGAWGDGERERDLNWVSGLEGGGKGSDGSGDAAMPLTNGVGGLGGVQEGAEGLSGWIKGFRACRWGLRDAMDDMVMTDGCIVA